MKLKSEMLMSIAALLASSCFNPDYDRVQISCSSASPQCPNDRVCNGFYCVIPQAEDLKSAIDSAIEINGCSARNGFQVGNAWACPGVFGKGGARGLCATGYSVCKDANTVSLPDCMRLEGFYVADSRAYDEFKNCEATASALVCEYINGRLNGLWMGCGQKLDYTQNCLRSSCSGFSQVLNTVMAENLPQPPWIDSQTIELDQQQNINSKNGVLCCK